MRIASPWHAAFAVTLIALGVASLFTRDLAAIFQPFPPRWADAREPLVYATALAMIGGGAGLLWSRTAAASAGLLTLGLFAWMVVFKVPLILRAPLTVVNWETWAETAVLVAAAWVLFAAFAGGRTLAAVAGSRGLRWAHILYGVALVAFGAAHFAYAKLTASLVPHWLPEPTAWAYATGLAYVAAGLAILVGRVARLAAILAAVQIAGFTLLVWAPVIATGHAVIGQWREAVVSWTLTAAAWALADSYRAKSARR